MSKTKRNLLSRSAYRWILIFFTSILAFFSLILPIALRPDAFPIQVGQVSPNTIVAPNTLTFISEVLANRAKNEASKMVSDRYLPADPAITRTQIDDLQIALNYINSVRSDVYSSNAQKLDDLLKIKVLNLSDISAAFILTLSDSRWQLISQESIAVLEQVMRNAIREDQIIDNRTRLPSLISFGFPEDQANLVFDMVVPFITANSLFSGEETDLARQKAIDSVEPITRTMVTNQTIVSRGQIVTEEQYEVLQLFGLVKPQSKTQDFVSSASIVVILAFFIVFYFRNRHLSILHDLRSITVIAVGLLIFLFGARFLIPNRAIIPYFYPLPAFAIILATLFNLEIAVIFSISLGLLAAFGLQISLDLSLFYMVTSFFAAISLGKGKRFTSFLYSALAIAISGSLILLAYKLTDPLSDILGLATLIGVSFLNGIASASIALMIQYLLSQLMGLPTPLHLLDISRPDHPLQKYLLQHAPGTYQHSLQVSNLAERAAETIGANPLLTRVGTIYHDVGKCSNASFFIENQIPGNINPHNDMDVELAAQTIIQHVKDGVKLADKYHLPPRIKDFILEHHGTQITRYQYNRALLNNNNNESEIDSSLFTYPGPKPQSKETALLMLADGCEARARAELPANTEEMSILVNKVFEHVLKEGQLDNSTLTLRDISTIKESFISTLSNLHHPRIQYPETPNSNPDVKII